LTKASAVGEAHSLGGSLSGILTAVMDNGRRLDPRLTMAIKAVSQAEATARLLAPEVDLGHLAIAEGASAFRESINVDGLAERFERATARTAMDLVRRPPWVERALFDLRGAMGLAPIRVNVETRIAGPSVDHGRDLGKELTVGLIVAGQLIASAIAMSTLLQPALAAFQLVGLLAMAASWSSLIVSFAVLRRSASR
jgi:hypothetical protein